MWYDTIFTILIQHTQKMINVVYIWIKVVSVILNERERQLEKYKICLNDV